MNLPHNVAIFNELADSYDRWFDQNRLVYEAEIQALRMALPKKGHGLEVGVGTGRFAAPLNTRFGIDPARKALRIAHDRGLLVCQAFGEQLPFPDGLFDHVCLNTVDPFVPDFAQLLREANRVLKPGGRIVVGLIDLASPLGRVYEATKDTDPFYRRAKFHTTSEMVAILRQTGFYIIGAYQTIIGAPRSQLTSDQVEPSFTPEALTVREGHGQGAFVVLLGQKEGKQDE